MAAKGINISVTGDKKLMRAFDKLAVKTQKKFARKALRAAGKPILKAAKQNVPVRSGKLKKSLKLKSIKRSRTGVGVMVQTGSREKLGIPADDKFYYPAVIEFGGGNTKAQPYLRPAMDNNRAEAIRILGDELWKQIRAEARKGLGL